MARRIVKENLNNGIIQYRVETNRIWWFIPWRWHTDTYTYTYLTETSRRIYVTNYAVFDNIDEAKIYCGIDEDKGCKREVVYEEKKKGASL